jgi:hypothetical protein
MEDSIEISTEKQRLKNLAIQGLIQQYPRIPQDDIREIFGYLERFCKLTNNGNVPLQIFKSSSNCSIAWMKGKVDMFFLNCARTYTRMNPKQVIVKMLGQEAYDAGLEAYSRSPISKIDDDDDDDEIDVALLEGETPKQIKGTMEDVDGGSRRRRKTKTSKRKIKTKTKKTKKQRRGSKKLRKTRK